MIDQFNERQKRQQEGTDQNQHSFEIARHYFPLSLAQTFAKSVMERPYGVDGRKLAQVFHLPWKNSSLTHGLVRFFKFE
ncbi:MAG: hypothetical protein NTV52_21890 [Acidobacteria bacterium]|nr:hypothetical protein [Acidobacteriota bacterium]